LPFSYNYLKNDKEFISIPFPRLPTIDKISFKVPDMVLGYFYTSFKVYKSLW
jgi:hypothetical protein